MEVFGFLKFRRSFSSSGSSTTTTITSSASDSQALEADDDNSFFDLVFAPPNSDIRTRRNDNDDDNDDNFKRKISPVENRSPISLLRSPQKFKVLILGFKKSKLDKTEMHNEGKEFPISSLFSRDTSLRSQLNHERYEESSSSSSSSFKSKQFSKQVVNLIKPLYVKVSSKYNSKNSKKKFREACRSLVKSRSTSSSSSSAGMIPIPINRRDDSEKQQQDGIQSAILYCKRSYSSNSSSSCSYLQRVISEDEKQRISI